MSEGGEKPTKDVKGKGIAAGQSSLISRERLPPRPPVRSPAPSSSSLALTLGPQLPSQAAAPPPAPAAAAPISLALTLAPPGSYAAAAAGHFASPQQSSEGSNVHGIPEQLSHPHRPSVSDRQSHISGAMYGGNIEAAPRPRDAGSVPPHDIVSIEVHAGPRMSPSPSVGDASPAASDPFQPVPPVQPPPPFNIPPLHQIPMTFSRQMSPMPSFTEEASPAASADSLRPPPPINIPVRGQASISGSSAPDPVSGNDSPTTPTSPGFQ